MKDKYALISLSDKSNLDILLAGLKRNNFHFVATNSSAQAIIDLGYECQKVEDITSYPEFLSGRVKTLQPEIHGGILADLDNPQHVKELEDFNLNFFSLVICNLYPFADVLESNDDKRIIENIDIGGVTLLRAAAKNFKHVGILCDSSDYEELIKKLDNNLYDLDYKHYLAGKAFRLCAEYDYLIASYFESQSSLRYGENPHQKATYTKTKNSSFSLSSAKVLQGKALSYNNILDIDAAFLASYEFEEPCAISIKHNTICGVGFDKDINKAYEKCFQADSKSIFGGIVILNRPVDKALAEELTKIFLEIIIAPEYSEEALEVFKAKKNLRVIKGDFSVDNFTNVQTRSVVGGLLKQEDTNEVVLDIENPLYNKLFRIVKNVKSNGVIIAQDDKLLAVSGGMVSRIDACEFALSKALKNDAYDASKPLILASDGFFPFNDIVDLAQANNIKTIICPSGSINDENLKQACEKAGIELVFTNLRYFKH